MTGEASLCGVLDQILQKRIPIARELRTRKLEQLWAAGVSKVFCGHYHRSQYSTVQYSTVQYSTVQYSTLQYSTVHLTAAVSRNAGGFYRDLEVVVTSALGCQLGADTHGMRLVRYTFGRI